MHAIGNNDFCQLGAASERIGSNGYNTTCHSKVIERDAAGESIIPDCLHAAWEVYFGQRGTILKRVFANCCGILRNDYFRKGAAIFKCIIADVPKTGRNFDQCSAIAECIIADILNLAVNFGQRRAFLECVRSYRCNTAKDRDFLQSGAALKCGRTDRGYLAWDRNAFQQCAAVESGFTN